MVALNSTVEPETKLAPFTVSVNAGPPGAAEDGLRLEIVGERIVNVAAFDVAPPVFTTVMAAVPALVIRLAVTAAVSCAAPTKTVLNAVPLNCTVAPLTKLAPFTVSVNACPPAAAETGFRLEIVGAEIVNVAAPDVDPLGFTTVMGAVPAVVSSAAVTVAVSCVPLMKEVLSAVPLNCTVAPLTKLDPLDRKSV